MHYHKAINVTELHFNIMTRYDLAVLPNINFPVNFSVFFKQVEILFLRKTDISGIILNLMAKLLERVSLAHTQHNG